MLRMDNLHNFTMIFCNIFVNCQDYFPIGFINNIDIGMFIKTEKEPSQKYLLLRGKEDELSLTLLDILNSFMMRV